MISVENVTKKYGDFTAVKDVSLDVKKGEIFGFLGPNGAGKTTTIKMIVTLQSITSGKITLNDFDVSSQENEVRESIGIVFQEPTVDDLLTAEENLRFHADVYGMDPHLFEKRAAEVLEMVELTDWRKRKVEDFSGGMKRRLEIARGLIHHPTVLFLDEPTIGLDPQTRATIWRYVLELRQRENLTIFLTTHYMDEAEYCDRIAIIDHGEIIARGSPAELKSQIGNEIITLKTENNDAALAQIKELLPTDQIISLNTRNGSIAITVKDGSQALIEITRGLKTRIDFIDMKKPSMDDVFLQLTGRTVRDTEATTEEKNKSFRRGFGRRFR